MIKTNNNKKKNKTCRNRWLFYIQEGEAKVLTSYNETRVTTNTTTNIYYLAVSTSLDTARGILLRETTISVSGDQDIVVTNIPATELV